MKELTILDFALGIALLYHWGADGKEIRNFANASKLEVFEVREDGSKVRRWAPAAPVSSKKVRIYNERKAAYEAQEKAKAK